MNSIELHDFLAIKELLETLNPNERRVIILYYFSGLNGREIGEQFSRTQQRIDFIRQQALKKMKAYREILENGETF